MVERSLDLLIVLVKPKHAEITQNIYLSIAPALFNILNTSDDPGILQSGTQLLQGLVGYSVGYFVYAAWDYGIYSRNTALINDE